jgi:hypothetical protein
MDKYNCGTCVQRDQCRSRIAVGQQTLCGGNLRYDIEPQHMHPGPNGESIVATAIAAVEFGRDDSKECDEAWHTCEGYLVAEWVSVNGEWVRIRGGNLFCTECGNRLPTVSQLPAEYEEWKAQKGGKERHG